MPAMPLRKKKTVETRSKEKQSEEQKITSLSFGSYIAQNGKVEDMPEGLGKSVVKRKG
jgi:hypothetical protein